MICRPGLRPLSLQDNSRSIAKHKNRAGFFGALAVAALLCVAAGGASAATLTVNTLSDSSDASGSCTSSGTCSLRDAITQAASGDTVNFTVTGTITLGSALPTISANLTITGPGANLLTVSGAGSYQIFSVSSGNVTLSGLTIANGVGACGGIDRAGGGICVLGGSLTVSASTFSGNSAAYGGGIYFDGTTLIISGSTFTDNSAKFVTEPEGGAIAVLVGNATIDNDTFSGNSTTFAAGAILVFGSTTVTVTNSTFSGNSGPNGSAIFNVGTLIANNNIFSGNSAPSGGLGGAVLNDGGSTVISYNVFYNNSGGDCALCTPTNSSSGDPKLLPLGYYGGTTETLALAPGSAALCAGNSADAVDAGNNLLTADQRGFAMDLTCAPGSVDAGAVQTNQYVVTTLTDKTDGTPECTSGTGTTCSLRDAMGLANSTGGDITFLSSLTSTSSPGTINLGTGTNTSLPAITGQVNILGPGANQLTVSGNNSTSVGTVFTVNAGATALLYGLTVTGGNMQNNPGGGGIYNKGTLTVLDSAVSGNTAFNGGGIFSNGTLTVIGSTISGNQGNNGGGIASVSGATLAVVGSTISGNTASGGGGGIYSYPSFTLTGSTVSDNSTTCSGPCISPGGGIEVGSNTVTLTNSIVAGNSASANDGGFAENADISGNIANDGGNLYGTSTSGTSNVNPGLSGLQYNGIGATLQTAIPLPGSPAICAGLVSNIPAGTTTDERGYPLQPAGGYCTSAQVDAGAVQTNYTSVGFVQQPTDTPVNTAITPSPAVEVLETDTLLSSNNTDAVNGVPITLAYSGGSSELPGATLTQTTAGGVATFSGLDPNTTGTGFSFSVGAGGAGLEVVSGTTLTATSDRFDVTSPSISIAKFHTGTFTQGSKGNWNLLISNIGGASTSGIVTVSDTLPSGYTLFSFNSTGNLFTCTGISAVTCTGTPDLAANSSNTITLTVDIPPNSPSSVSNTASVWGGGDPVHSNSNTAAVSNTDTATVSATTTTTASNQTATFSNNNQSVMLSATVTSAATVNAGTVTFTVLNGGTPVGTATTSGTVTNGSASASYTLPAGTAGGTYTIQAVYSGSANFTGSSDSAHTLTVNGAGTTTAASSQTAAFSNSSQSVTLSATVTSAAGTVNAGTVTFAVFNGPTQIGTPTTPATVTNGSAMASYTLPAGTAAGTYTIQANYIGSANFTSSSDNSHTLTVNGAGTTTAASNQTATFSNNNQSVTLSATVTSASGTVSAGTVTFTVLNGATPVGTATTSGTVTNGSASVLYTLPAGTAGGTYTIQAVYNGSANFTGSSDSAHTLVVSGAGTTTTASNQTATFSNSGQSVTLSAKVTSAAGTVSAGTVIFTVLNGGTPVGTATNSGTVSNGSASASYTLPAGTAGGTYTIQANYIGSANFTSSSDSAHTLTVNGAGTTTAASNQTAAFSNSSQSVTLSATVTSAAGTVNAGTVVFTVFNGPTQIGTPTAPATVTNGSAMASYTLPAGTAAGTYTIQAVFNGSANFTGSSDSSHTLTVNGAGTTTAASNQTTTFSNNIQSVTLSATVTSAAGTVSAGTVTFTVLNGATPVGTATTSGTVTNGSASVLYTLLAGTAGGTYTIQAVYNGSANFTGSSDSAHTLTVNGAGTTTAASNQTTTFSNSGQSVTLSATVTSAAGPVSAGTVTFTVLNGGTPVGTATTSGTVTNGSASVLYTLPAGTAAGTYTIQAVFNGSANFTGSSDNTHTLTVNPALPTVSANAYSITYGTALTNAQLTGTATYNSASVPGTFTFTSAAGTVLNTGSNQSEQVTFTPTDTTDYATVPTTVLITVKQAILTITANNATRVYGTANPTFTGSVTGQQNGDTFIESFSTTATASSPVNAYTIVPSVTGTDLSDYTQSLTDGTLTITQAASTTTLGVSSTSITPGQSVTLTATVNDASPGSTGTPTGTVNFYDGGALLNTTPAAISGGVATYATTALAPGVTHVITATYSGDVNFTGSSSTANAATNIAVAPLDFTMTISGPSSATVIPGRSIAYQVTVAPLYGSYAGTVNFAVSGLPPGATASFSPSSIAANGGPQTITVTITAAPVTAANRAPSPPSPVRRGIPFTLACALLFGIGAIRRRGKSWQRLLSITILLAGGMAATLIGGCGSANGFFAQAPQNYTITITATGGNLQHTASVTLNVQ